MTYRAFSLVLIVSFLGCGDDSRGSGSGTDAGVGSDGAMGGDSGSHVDAGGDTDSGVDGCPTGEYRPYDGAPCEPVNCGSVSGPDNGSVEVENTTYESVVTYGCDEGHMLVGDATRTCTADGTWSGDEPTCEVTDCGAPTAPTNGSVSMDGTGAGDKATYDCDDGYWLVRGQYSVCTDDGWMGETPSCEPILDCVCDGFMYIGETVISTGTTPPAGTEGTVYSGIGSGHVGVEWDGWTDGHAGNCGIAPAVCGTCELSGSSKRYMACGDLTSRRLYCVCGAVYSAGDRVVLLEDVTTLTDALLPAGTVGTVIAGNDSGASQLLVEWEGWTEGHDGNCVAADCGECTDSGTSRYYVACDVIGRAAP